MAKKSLNFHFGRTLKIVIFTYLDNVLIIRTPDFWKLESKLLMLDKILDMYPVAGTISAKVG